VAPWGPPPKVRFPIVSVPAVTVWLAGLPPKMAELPAVQEPNAPEVLPSSQLPPESQFIPVVLELSLALFVVLAFPSHHSIAALAVCPKKTRDSRAVIMTIFAGYLFKRLLLLFII